MDRRTALLTVAGLAGAPSAWAISQTPYGPNQATDYRVLDLANVREVIVRLPRGNVVVQTDDIWDALHAYELEKAKGKK
jgi:hypothetical protein